jgi:hypothetical protein
MLSHDFVFLTLSEGVALFFRYQRYHCPSFSRHFMTLMPSRYFDFADGLCVLVRVHSLFNLLNKIFLNSISSSRKVMLSFVVSCRISMISSPNFDNELVTELTSSSSLACSALNSSLSWSMLSILRFKLKRPEIAPSGCFTVGPDPKLFSTDSATVTVVCV